MRALLRALTVFTEQPTPFDAERADADPAHLFEAWIHAAIAAGVVQPHAATLSTVDERGRPDARVLILKDVGAGRWWFASSRRSRKGVQLAGCPAAALTFYWPAQGRQVWVRGLVEAEGAELSAADFLARSEEARSVAVTGRESQRLGCRAELEAVVEITRGVASRPDAVAPDWTVFALVADEVEF
jgi:pyridoxamine 5'-phosphate oxidase